MLTHPVARWLRCRIGDGGIIRLADWRGVGVNGEQDAESVLRVERER